MNNLWLAIAAAILFCVFLYFIGSISLWLNLYRLRSVRSQEDTKMFVIHFMNKGIPCQLTYCVYQYMQQWIGIKDFPVHPEDEMCKTYGMCDEDLEEAIFEIADRCVYKISLPEDYMTYSLNTVDDLVCLLWNLYSQSHL